MEKTIGEMKSKNQKLRQQLRQKEKEKEKISIKNHFLEISAQIRAKNPILTDDEVVIKTMDFMKELFLQTVHQVADDESMTSFYCTFWSLRMECNAFWSEE